MLSTKITHAVRASPELAIGVAAGAGFVLGGGLRSQTGKLARSMATRMAMAWMMGKVAEEVPEQYGDVVRRLEDVVARLEGGTLSLEDSLKSFEEGIKLVRRGEQLLNTAEKRIEELLNEDGRDVVVPLQSGVKPPVVPSAPAAPASRGSSGTSRAAPPPEDDVPF